jgi:ribose/xylose/arabinose/galactoside ABC-type transport system permease subunit
VCAAVMLYLAPDQLQSAREAMPWYVIAAGIAAAAGVGFLIGTLHAWLITVVQLPPFVATLATLVGLRSLARQLAEFATYQVEGMKKTQITVADNSFRYLGNTVWVPVLLFAVAALLTWLLMSRTVTGRHLYALGGNEEAARLSGIRTDRLKWLAYCLAGVLSSIAGVLYIGYSATASPQTLGIGYELNAIAAAVVGGCSLQGGVGTIPGTVLGVLFLQSVIDGIAKVIERGSDVYEGTVVGVLVVFAVAFGKWDQARQTGQQYFSGWLGTFAGLTLALLAMAISAFSAFMLNNRAGAIAGAVALVALAVMKWRPRHGLK